MQLLHTKPILDCTENDKRCHQAELDKLLSLIQEFPNVDCDIAVSYEDDYHKNYWSPYHLETNLHRLEEVLQDEDTTHGLDAFLTAEGDLAFKAYGQTYRIQGEEGILTTLVKVNCYGEGMSPLDMSRSLGVSQKAVILEEEADD